MNSRWLRFLPSPLRQRLEGRHLLQKILGNSGWLVADKIVRMWISLIVTVWMARYLGPKDFGLLNYALAIVGLFAAFAGMGLQNIVVRDLVRRPDKQKNLLASAFLLRLVGASFGIGLTLLAIILLRPDDYLAWGLVIIMSMAFLSQSADVIDYRYQAEVNARPIVLIRNGVFILFSLLKIAIILGGGSVLMFAIAFSVETFVVAIAFIVLANRSGAAFRLGDATLAECFRLFRESWPMIFAGLSVVVYMRIDQVMLGGMIGDSAVGIFSAAVRVSEVWFFVPIAIMASVAAALTTLHQQSSAAYEKKLIEVMRLLVWLAVLVAIVFTFLAPLIIVQLYGPGYAESARVLVVHGWTGVLVSIGLVSATWFTNEGLLRISMYQALVGAIVNVSCNLLLIPLYGVVGAAISTIIGLLAAVVLADVLNRKTWKLLHLKKIAVLGF